MRGYLFNYDTCKFDIDPEIFNLDYEDAISGKYSEPFKISDLKDTYKCTDTKVLYFWILEYLGKFDSVNTIELTEASGYGISTILKKVRYLVSMGYAEFDHARMYCRIKRVPIDSNVCSYCLKNCQYNANDYLIPNKKKIKKFFEEHNKRVDFEKGGISKYREEQIKEETRDMWIRP
jgi:hypothetical protein